MINKRFLFAVLFLVLITLLSAFVLMAQGPAKPTVLSEDWCSLSPCNAASVGCVCPAYITGTGAWLTIHDIPKIRISGDPTAITSDSSDHIVKFYLEMLRRHPEETKQLLVELRTTVHMPDSVDVGYVVAEGPTMVIKEEK